MDIQLVQLYVLVCTVYDTRRATCFQRLSNNPHQGYISDQELITIYWFGHLNQRFEKKAMHEFVQTYWLQYFPKLPAYQTLVARLNRLEASFQTLGAYLKEQLPAVPAPEVDQVIDSLPVMLARGGHAYTAKVAPMVADVGYCASKKQWFHGVRLHTVAGAPRRTLARAATNLGTRRIVSRRAQCQRTGNSLADDDLDRGLGLRRCRV